MSNFDLVVVLKTLIGNPNNFQATRDNLIQGYINKLAFQHFAQNGMLDQWFMKYDNGTPIPTLDDQPPASVFYGISQGTLSNDFFSNFSSIHSSKILYWLQVVF